MTNWMALNSATNSGGDIMDSALNFVSRNRDREVQRERNQIYKDHQDLQERKYSDEYEQKEQDAFDKTFKADVNNVVANLDKNGISPTQDNISAGLVNDPVWRGRVDRRVMQNSDLPDAEFGKSEVNQETGAVELYNKSGELLKTLSRDEYMQGAMAAATGNYVQGILTEIYTMQSQPSTPQTEKLLAEKKQQVEAIGNQYEAETGFSMESALNVAKDPLNGQLEPLPTQDDVNTQNPAQVPANIATPPPKSNADATSPTGGAKQNLLNKINPDGDVPVSEPATLQAKMDADLMRYNQAKADPNRQSMLNFVGSTMPEGISAHPVGDAISGAARKAISGAAGVAYAGARKGINSLNQIVDGVNGETTPEAPSMMEDAVTGYEAVDGMFEKGAQAVDGFKDKVADAFTGDSTPAEAEDNTSTSASTPTPDIASVLTTPRTKEKPITKVTDTAGKEYKVATSSKAAVQQMRRSGTPSPVKAAVFMNQMRKADGTVSDQNVRIALDIAYEGRGDYTQRTSEDLTRQTQAIQRGTLRMRQAELFDKQGDAWQDKFDKNRTFSNAYWKRAAAGSFKGDYDIFNNADEIEHFINDSIANNPLLLDKAGVDTIAGPDGIPMIDYTKLSDAGRARIWAAVKPELARYKKQEGLAWWKTLNNNWGSMDDRIVPVGPRAEKNVFDQKGHTVEDIIEFSKTQNMLPEDVYAALVERYSEDISAEAERLGEEAADRNQETLKER